MSIADCPGRVCAQTATGNTRHRRFRRRPLPPASVTAGHSTDRPSRARRRPVPAPTPPSPWTPRNPAARGPRPPAPIGPPTVSLAFPLLNRRLGGRRLRRRSQLLVVLQRNFDAVHRLDEILFLGIRFARLAVLHHRLLEVTSRAGRALRFVTQRLVAHPDVIQAVGIVLQVSERR